MLTIHSTFLNVEASGSDGLTTIDAHEAVHTERVLHGVHHFLLKRVTKTIYRSNNALHRVVSYVTDAQKNLKRKMTENDAQKSLKLRKHDESFLCGRS